MVGACILVHLPEARKSKRSYSVEMLDEITHAHGNAATQNAPAVIQPFLVFIYIGAFCRRIECSCIKRLGKSNNYVSGTLCVSISTCYGCFVRLSVVARMPIRWSHLATCARCVARLLYSIHSSWPSIGMCTAHTTLAYYNIHWIEKNHMHTAQHNI